MLFDDEKKIYIFSLKAVTDEIEKKFFFLFKNENIKKKEKSGYVAKYNLIKINNNSNNKISTVVMVRV